MRINTGGLGIARVTLTIGATVSLAVIAACTDSGKSITAPQSPRTATISSGGYLNAKHVDLCVDATSPAGNYTFFNTHENDPVAIPGNGFEWPVASGNWWDNGDGGDGTTVFNVTSGTPYVVAAGSCITVLDRTSGDLDFMAGTHNTDSWSGVTITYISNPMGAVYDHTDCLTDVGVVAPQQANPPGVWPNPGYPCDNHNNPTRAFANYEHGTTVTFNFVAAQEQVIPMFVIGDVEAHGIGTNVNFWGAQWWKNNFMSGTVSHGVASNKGYALYADVVDLTPGSSSTASDRCGTWSTRVGNSPPPPKVIPEYVGIIVTQEVIKKGPNLGGGIYEIVIVHSDGGYGPNPGHPGNGPVTSVVCPAPLE